MQDISQLSPPASAPNAIYTVQEAAALTDLSEHTLRYYERAGLLPTVGRQGTGRHRRYSYQNVQSLIFIRRMRATGMPIHVLKRYMELLWQGDGTLAERRQILEAHRTAVCAHIAELRECLNVIDFKLANYDDLARMLAENLRSPQPK